MGEREVVMEKREVVTGPREVKASCTRSWQRVRVCDVCVLTIAISSTKQRFWLPPSELIAMTPALTAPQLMAKLTWGLDEAPIESTAQQQPPPAFSRGCGHEPSARKRR